MALASLLALCLLTAPSAEAGWLAPRNVSLAPQGRNPQVAVDGAGDVIVAWVAGTSSQDIDVAEHPVGSEWTTPIARMSDPTAANACEQPRLAVNSTGAAILVADCGSGATPMRYAARAANGTWSASGEIPGSGNGEEPRVAIDDSGNSVVVWEASSTVQSNYRKAAGTWEGSALQVSPAGKVSHEPDVAVSPTGRAIAVWLEDRDSEVSDPVVQVNSISRQGSAAWSGFKFLSGTTTGTTPVVLSSPQISIGAGGRFSAWSQLAGTNPTVLKNAWGSPGDFAGWGEGGSHLGGDGVYGVETPQVGFDDNGDAVAIWRAFKAGIGDFGVQAATTGFINDSWSSPVTLLAGGGNGFFEPDVAVDGAGDAFLVWSLGSTVTAVSRPAGSPLTSSGTTISTGHKPFNALHEDPTAAVDDDGNGIVAWASEGTSPTHIAVAVDDVTPPSVSAANPAPVAAGTPVSLSATANDTWSPVSLSWDFGDGASATGSSVSHAYATAGTKTATVTATDTAGNTTSATVSITVTSPAAGGGGGAGGGKGTGGGAGGRHRVALTVKVPAQSWKQIAKAKAIKVRCRLDVAGKCAIKADLAVALATRLGFKVGKSRKEIVIGKGFAQAKAGRFAIVVVKLTPKALAKIAAATKPVPVKLAITGTATAPGRDPASLSRTLKIVRP